MEIPKYLKEYTTIKSESKDAIILKVLCDCGCSTFYLLKNLLDVKEEERIKDYEKRLGSWRNIENYTDPMTQIRYLVARNMFGKICDKIPISEIFDIQRTNIIKVKCSECGKEKVIYDNRHYGYNAVVAKKSASDEYQEYRYDLMQENAMAVEITLKNEFTYDEFCKNEGGTLSKEEYASAFSYIEIDGIMNGRKKKFFEEETA